jgi:SSS family solute:Na+ symporter
MNLSFINWAIIAGFFILITALATYVRRYTKNVVGFLAADRCAGRYMLSVSEGMSGLGAITIISLFQDYYQAGFTALWWSNINTPVGTIIAMTGWATGRAAMKASAMSPPNTLTTVSTS